MLQGIFQSPVPKSSQPDFRIYFISEGGLTETIADIRLIFQAALLTNSVALILAHNHPSGNLKPSPEDIRLTKQVREASNFMRIKILDHIILQIQNTTVLLMKECCNI